MIRHFSSTPDHAAHPPYMAHRRRTGRPRPIHRKPNVHASSAQTSPPRVPAHHVAFFLPDHGDSVHLRSNFPPPQPRPPPPSSLAGEAIDRGEATRGAVA
uniref:Uncharacterized protein n=1 Tax=Oryza punctata TaxID=4537 RepID=A0A0E0L866_ORYPU